MKYLGPTGLKHLCNKISTALAGKLSLDGGTMNDNAKITFTTGATDPVDLSTTMIGPGLIKLVDENGCGLIQASTLEVSTIYPLNYTHGTTLSFEGPVEFYGDTTYHQGITADTGNSTVPFNSSDTSLNPTAWTDVDMLKSGETHKSIMQKVSAMFKNIRYLKKMVSSLQDSQFLGWCDTYSFNNKILSSDIINLSPLSGAWVERGLYILEGYFEIDNPSAFNGMLAAQINDGPDSGNFVYDTRAFPYQHGCEVVSIRIQTITAIFKDTDVSMVGGQLNSQGYDFNATGRLCISKLSNLQ